jgi:Family of unknown function (DUF6758)
MATSRCVRCRAEVAADRTGWRCHRHGLVEPLRDPVEFAPAAIADLVAAPGTRSPGWLPWPLPTDWAVSGLRWTGGPDMAARAVAVGCSGPGLFGGTADLVVVAEEPGIGLGASYAGANWTDPDPGLAAGPPDGKVVAAGRPTPVWSVAGESDRAVYVGEALGRWLWLVVSPSLEAMVVHDDLHLIDLLDPALAYEIPVAGLAGRLLD